MKLLTSKSVNETSRIVPIYLLNPTIRAKWHPENFNLIKENMDKDGLDFPLVCWLTTRAKWFDWAESNIDLIGPEIERGDLWNKEKVYCVMCGNNRLQAAKELGVSHIEIKAFSDRKEVSKECSRQRKHWRKKAERLLELDTYQKE